MTSPLVYRFGAGCFIAAVLVLVASLCRAAADPPSSAEAVTEEWRTIAPAGDDERTWFDSPSPDPLEQAYALPARAGRAS